MAEQTEKRGWLIETARGTYWAGSKSGRFTDDITDAVWFVRFEDAERVRADLLQHLADYLRSTEHIAMGGGARG